ncbi:MAG: hypothetical protein J1F24_01885 [Oscillospiraceae bacterium]|nr:hypothetical protein [Oscillospiraceae bacterium]
MIKKIGAIVLALVLCMSVIVVPASAAKVELGDAKIAFSLEWDKASYSAGETAYLSVYMTAADDLPLFTGSLVIGLNSAVISQADNPIATVSSNAVTGETFGSYWKNLSDGNIAWLATTVAPKVTAANTAEEQGLYDHYLKVGAAKYTYGTHPNAGNNKDGFYGSDFDPDEPIVTIALVVADVPDGTPLNAAITSGSLTCTPVQTTWKYYTNPGNATTSANVAAADFNISQAKATATVGETAESSIVEWSKAQIRFRGIGADFTGTYGNEFDVRTVAKITKENFNATFESEENAKANIDNIGFVYGAKSNFDGTSFDLDKAKEVAKNGSEGNYVRYNVSYMQDTGDEYIFTCLIDHIEDNDDNKKDGVICLAFVEYDGEFYFFDAAVTVNYGTLYNDWFKG